MHSIQTKLFWCSLCATNDEYLVCFVFVIQEVSPQEYTPASPGYSMFYLQSEDSNIQFYRITVQLPV